MTAIIVLTVLGVILILLEIIIPGGILGFIGTAMLIGASYIAFTTYSPIIGFLVFTGEALLALCAFAFTFKVLPNTKFGNLLIVKKAIDGKSEYQEHHQSLINKQGITNTTFSPSGIIIIDGEQYEAYSQDGYIPKGTPVTVIGDETFRLIVKKTNS